LNSFGKPIQRGEFDRRLADYKAHLTGAAEEARS
jgi:hypothetical protein